ncbi:methyltransferase domain-containing protein [Hyphomonas sp.]|uniref:methyltransferase domain-containing protein n=1 Tax=Hyphomonas sp. TaxID=87 RepID=UPI0030F8478C
MSVVLEFDEKAARAVEAMYKTPDVVAQRAHILAMMNPQPGEAVLDIGVGPGLLAYDLARMVGEKGRLVGVDVSQAMLTMTRARLADLCQAEVIEADATALGVESEAFDLAVSTQVYEYVADMTTALGELRRVLRPGGRVVIVDTDWDSIVWHSTDHDRMTRVLKCWDAHLVDPHLPATLGAQLRKAGFEVQRCEIIPMLSASYQPYSYAAGIMRSIHGFVRANGERHGLSAEDIQAWHDDQLQLIEQGGFFFSLNRYAFVARR